MPHRLVRVQSGESLTWRHSIRALEIVILSCSFMLAWCGGEFTALVQEGRLREDVLVPQRQPWSFHAYERALTPSAWRTTRAFRDRERNTTPASSQEGQVTLKTHICYSSSKDAITG